MPTSKMTDVAKAAGVSIATVGRVIHNNGYVSPESRALVEQAIRDLGYVPNRMASALKGRKSGIIGSLITHNPNFLYERINESILKAAQTHGYEVFSMEGRIGQQDEERILDQFIGMQVEGIVIISNTNVPATALEKLYSLRIPVVAVERCYERPGVDNLKVLDREGVQSAARQAIDRGHRELALIAAEPFEQSASGTVERERYEGFMAAISEADVPIKDVSVELRVNYAMEEGRRAMQRIWESGKRPTCVCATSDQLAAGAMQYLYQQGVRIPEEVSILGYDNALSAMLAPPIDSVDLDLESIGENVLELLRARQQDFERPEEVRLIETRYIDRGTVRMITE